MLCLKLDEDTVRDMLTGDGYGWTKDDLSSSLTGEFLIPTHRVAEIVDFVFYGYEVWVD